MSINPCVKCGSTDIHIYDQGYSSFNVGGGQCKGCGNKEYSNNLGCFPTKEELTEIWNRGNPIYVPQDEVDKLTKIIKDALRKKRDIILKYKLDKKSS